jgi:hypothetical protein
MRVQWQFPDRFFGPFLGSFAEPFDGLVKLVPGLVGFLLAVQRQGQGQPIDHPSLPIRVGVHRRAKLLNGVFQLAGTVIGESQCVQVPGRAIAGHRLLG